MQAPLTLLAVALVLASVVALAAERVWWADLLVHFRVQYVAVASLLLGLSWWFGRRDWLLAAVLALLLNAVPVLRAMPAPAPIASASAATPAGERVRIASFNLFWRNTDHDAAIAWARATQADVLVFVEVDARWERALDRLRDQYPHAHGERRAGHTGTLVLSRWPLGALQVLDTGTPGTPEVALAVERPAGPLRLIAVHASWPMGRAASAARARDFAAVADAAREAASPVVAIGDFNITPWSPHFGALLARAGLRDAASGFGWQPTWPRFLPPLGLQIDHALVSPDVIVNSFARANVEGSDHRPIVVDLQLRSRGGSVVGHRAPGAGGDRG